MAAVDLYSLFARAEGWIFSKMACEEGAPTVQHSSEFKLNICQNNIEQDTVQQIFDWLRYAITEGRNSTPRASLVQMVQNVTNDEETITGVFSSLQMDQE